jgi:SAM-dependent methyltransferase
VNRNEETMSEIPTKATFEALYAGRAPWDIGKPQQTFVDHADQITGSILDAGCGTGDTALFFASRGNMVTGIDFLEEAINRANRKATERGLMVAFLVMDATTLKDLSVVFDNITDSGLFHCFSDDDRKKYVEGLATVLKPGGRLFLMCFSDEEPFTQGPRRVSQKELHDSFFEGWSIETIEASRFEVIPDFNDMTFNDMTFSEGGPKAWFMVVVRRGS